MKTVIKAIAALVGLLLVVLVAVGVYAQFIFDPNDYKQQITAWVKQHTGRELAIQGRIRLSLFPWLAVDIGRLSLGNRKGFGSRPFAKAASIRVGIRLVPLLLNRQVKTKTIDVEGLTVNLVVDRSGRANWGDVAAIKEISASSGNINKEVSSSKVGEGVEQYLAGLAIGGVHIGHAAVNWDDQRRGRHFSVKDFQLESGAILPRKAFPLKARFEIEAQPAAVRSKVRIHGEGLVEPLQGAYRIDDFHIDTVNWGKTLPVNPLSAKLRGGLLFDMKTRKLTLSKMVAQAFGATATGTIDGIQLLDAPAFTGKLELQGVNLRSIANLMSPQPILTNDSDVLGMATAKVNFDANSHHVNVSYLHAEFDASTVNGVFAVRDFDHPFTKFEMFIDQIDLDRYLPPPAQAAAPVTPATAAGAGAARLPVKTLRALGLDGKLQIGEFKVARLRMRNARLDVQADQGRIALRPSASLYGGKYEGNIHIDARGPRPRLSFDESVQGVRLAPLLKDTTDSDLLAGKADVHASFSLLADPGAIPATLSGKARFRLSDGTVRGINIARLIREAKAQLEGRPLAAAGPLQTDFTELSGTLTADHGIVENHDLTAKTPFLRLAGRGRVNLVTRAVDYHLEARIVDSPAGQDGQDLRALKGVTIPIRVSGTVSKLAFAPDLGEVAKRELGRRLKKELDKQLGKQGQGATDKKLEQLKERLRKNLDKLFHP